MKQLRAAILISLFLTNPVAAQNCILPSYDLANPPTSGEAVRSYIIGITKYRICMAEKDESASVRVKFPGQDELKASFIKRQKATLKLWQDRKTVPTGVQIREALKNTKSSTLLVDYVTHFNIAGALYKEKDSNLSSPYLDRLRNEGVNPRSEAARIANTRIPLPQAWFTIGTAEIYRASADVEMYRATEQLKKANKWYKYVLKIVRDGERKNRVILAEFRNLVTESTKKVEKARLAVESDKRWKNNIGQVPNDDLVKRLALAQKYLARRIRLLSRADEDLIKGSEGIKSALREAEQSVSAATKAFMEQKSRYGAVIKTIESKDARLVPVSQKEQQALRNNIAILSAEIAWRSKQSWAKDKARLAARKKHETAVLETKSEGEYLIVAGYVSVAFQAALEVQSSALNLVLASKGGLPGVLAEATSQLIGNGISGPTYYDATGIGRNIAVIPREKDTEDQSSDWPSEWGPQAFYDQAKKEGVAVPFRTYGDYANLNEAEIKLLLAKLKADKFHYSNTKNPLYRRHINVPKGIAKKVADQEKILLKAAEDLGKATGKAGLRALAGSIIRDVGASFAKEMTKEALKRFQAELIEGDALRDYMAAQLGIHEAAVAYRVARGLYWVNEKAISSARGTRDSYLEKLKAGDMVVEKSNAFYPLPGYRFSIELRSESMLNPRQFKADVELGGVKLIRNPGSTALVWMIPEDAKFGLELNEELNLKIEIK